MAYRVITVPVACPEPAIDELNQFLANHQVTEIDRQYDAHGGQVCWHFCVNYGSFGKKCPSNPTRKF